MKNFMLFALSFCGMSASAQFSDITIYGRPKIVMENNGPTFDRVTITIECDTYYQTKCMSLSTRGPVVIDRKLMLLQTYNHDGAVEKEHLGYVTNVERATEPSTEIVAVEFIKE